MEKLLEGPLYPQSRLNPPELMDLFITLLSDVYSTKQLLIKNLPFIVSKTYAKDVKLLLLDSAAVVNGQIIRLCLTKALLSQRFRKETPMLNGCLDLEQYLRKDVQESSAKTDAIILTHLIIAEGLEIDAFKILKKTAKGLKPASVFKLMSVCYKEAVESKAALEAMLLLYY